MAPTVTRTDRLLLLEVLLVLGLIVLSIVLYMRPAAERMTSIAWWNWVVLAGLFFAVVWLHNRRRRNRGHAALREAIREDAELSHRLRR